VLSTIKNSKAANWSPSRRFNMRRASDTPGPGVYNPSDYQNGHYLLSNFKTHGPPSFSKPGLRRNSAINKTETPGPGSYMPPSDFGYLEIYKFSSRTSQGHRSTISTANNTHREKFNQVRMLRSQNSTRVKMPMGLTTLGSQTTPRLEGIEKPQKPSMETVPKNPDL
jgi:hypothetical protein